FRVGQTRANSALVRLGPGGAVNVVAGMPAGTSVHVIVDVEGYFDDTNNNQPPFVTAGPPRSLQLPAIQQPGSLSLAGSVVDDGKPGGAPSLVWGTVAGPGTVSFAPANSATTTATFPLAGTYTLRLSATDGSLAAYSDVSVVVQPSRDAWRLVDQSTWGATPALATMAQNS